MGMCGVSTVVCGCGCARVCGGIRGCAPVCAGVHGCGSGQKGGLHGYVHVCGMNFQNFFWRIESLNQRTLIRILYEFLFLDPQLATNFGTGITSLASEGGTSED